MKKTFVGFLAMMMCLACTACAPMNLEKAEEKMEEAGYKVTVTEGDAAELVAENAVGVIVAVDVNISLSGVSGGMLTAILFDSFADANAYYKEHKDDEKEKEDQVIKKSGKWVYIGTENAIEDFTKMF